VDLDVRAGCRRGINTFEPIGIWVNPASRSATGGKGKERKVTSRGNNLVGGTEKGSSVLRN